MYYYYKKRGLTLRSRMPIVPIRRACSSTTASPLTLLEDMSLNACATVLLDEIEMTLALLCSQSILTI